MGAVRYTFINLASVTDRRVFVEANFRTSCHREMEIERTDAVDAAAAALVPGTLPGPAKACFLSHLKAIEASTAHADDLFIAEDDVLFGDASTRMIEAMAEGMPRQSWDVLFTDVCITDINTMIALFLMRKRLVASGQVQALDLADMSFCGSTGYIVNRESKEKLLGLLSASPLDLHYDLALRTLTYAKRIKTLAIVPFATSLSHFAETTQIQPLGSLATDQVWNAFRRFFWQGRDLDVVREALERLDAGFFDEESVVFSKIVGAMLSAAYQPK